MIALSRWVPCPTPTCVPGTCGTRWHVPTVGGCCLCRRGNGLARWAARSRSVWPAPVGVAWAGAPAARYPGPPCPIATAVAIWLDRRIDPGTDLNLSVDAMPLKNLLGESRAARRPGRRSVRFGGRLSGSARRTRAAAVNHGVAAARGEAIAASRPRGNSPKPSPCGGMPSPRRANWLTELAASERHSPRRRGPRAARSLGPPPICPPWRWSIGLALILGQFDLTFEYLDLADGPGHSRRAHARRHDVHRRPSAGRNVGRSHPGGARPKSGGPEGTAIRPGQTKIERFTVSRTSRWATSFARWPPD